MKNMVSVFIFDGVKRTLYFLFFLLLISDVAAQTAPGFTINKVSGCVPLSSVNFTETSTGGTVIRRDWNLGNGTIIPNGAAVVGTNYLTAQKFYVQLTVTFSNGDVKTKTDSVIVHPKPVADFIVSDTAGCVPHGVVFTDLSSTATGTVNDWTWDFGAGGGTVKNPAFTYNTAGNYNISLLVKNSWGCESDAASKFQYVRVYSKPVAAFTSSPAFSCNDSLTVSFSNTTTGGSPANNYKWYFGDGDSSSSKNPAHFYSAPGTYTVTLFASVGKNCSSTTTGTIYVGNVTPFFISAPDTVCINVPTQYSGSATPAPFYVKWLFGDNGASPFYSPVSHSFTTPGDYPVSLIAYTAQGCSDTITKMVHVKYGAGLVPFFINAPDTVCVNTATSFSGSSAPAPASVRWHFSDNGALQNNSPTNHSFTTAGNYLVSLIAYNAQGCADTIVNPVHVKPGPVTSFTPAKTNGCGIPFIVNFLNTTPAGSNLEFTWNFGDGSPLVKTYDTLPVPHTYTNFGNYTVTLTARDTLVGCVGTAATFSFIRIVRPVVNFTYVPPSGCLPLPVKFNTQVTGLIVPVISYVWNYGDGTKNDTLTSTTTNHIYTSAGTFNPTLTVITAECSYTSVSKPVDVISLCDDDGSGGGGGGGGGGFGLGKNCGNKYSVEFTDTVSNTIVTGWNFGDGSPWLNTGTLNPVTYNYTPPQKIYIVSVARLDTITNIRDTGRKRIIIIDEKANFVPSRTDICNFNSVNFNTVGIDSSAIAKYTWDFGDSTARQTINNSLYFNTFGLYLNGNTNHTYRKLGVFYVKLIIEDKLGCLDSIQYPVPVTVGGPVANFSALIQNSCLVPIKVSFNDSSKQNSTIPIVNWQWTFGDASPGLATTVDSTVNHWYTVNTYNVRLIVKDSIGCVDTITKPLIVPVNTTGPQAGFMASPVSGCSSPMIVAFTDTSKQNTGVPITNWQWTFGDGSPNFNTGADSVFNHTYTGNNYYNFYTVTLSIKDSFGCVSSVTKTNYIKIYKPKADFFSYDTLKCGSYNVFLYNNSAGYNATYTWNYGDGASSTGFYGSHNYAGEGNYNIKLVVKDENGCTDSITKPSYIKLVKPIADFKVGDTTKCAPTAITFSDSSQYASSYIWDFGDGGTGSTAKDPSPKIYALPGIYKVSLKVTGLNGCVDSTFKWIRVRGPIGTLTAVTGDGCKPYTINMKVSGSFISTYAWDYNDGTPVNPSTTDSVIFHTYNNSGKYIPNVVLTSPEGCPFTLRATDTVTVDEAKADFSFDKDKFCDNGVVTFTNLSLVPAFSSLKYRWDFGDGKADTVANPLPHLYDVPGSYTVKLWVSSLYGCVDSMIKTNAVTVNANPVAGINGDSIVCKPGQYIYLSSIASVDNVAQYQWYVDSVPVNKMPDLYYNFNAGNHGISLVVNTVNGCADSVFKNIIVDSLKAAFSMSQQKFCGNNGTVNFSNLSGSQFNLVKYQWLFGDNTGSVLQSPLHNYNDTGVYNVQLVATSQHGCTDTANLVKAVEIYNKPVASFTGDSLHCTPGVKVYKSNSTSANAITKYEWLVNGVPAGNSDELTYNFSPAGPFTISLKVTTGNGCTDIVTRQVIIDSIGANFTIVNPRICGLKPIVRFDNLSSSRFGNSVYTWDYGDGRTGTGFNPNHTYAAPGNYLVTLTAKAPNGCSNSFTSTNIVTIFNPTTATIVGEAEKCMQNRLHFSAAIFTEDVVTAYTWKLNTDSLSNLDTMGYNFINAGNYTVTLDLKTKYGCTFTTNKQVVIHPLPVPAAAPDTTVCLGVNVLLRSYDGAVYKWEPSASLQNINTANPLATPLVNEKYYVTVTTQYGCVQKDTVTVKVDNPVNLTVSNSDTLCSGTRVQIHANAVAAAYLWSPATGLSNPAVAHPFAAPTLTTTYTVVAYSGNVCKNDTGYVNIAVGNTPVVNAGPDQTVSSATTVQLQAQVNSNDVNEYLWSPAKGLSCTDCPSPQFIADDNITYRVTVQTIYKCVASDEVKIFVICGKGKLFIPNAFTPNHDGLNDRFYIKSYGLSQVKSMVIFDRWGKKVFERRNTPVNDPSYGWDGYVNGNPVENTAAFVYVIDVLCNDGQEFNFKGMVMLVK